MYGIGKIALKVVTVAAIAFGVGYTKYRLNGGEPLRKLYKEVKAERLAAEANRTKAMGKAIEVTGTVE